MDRGIDYSVLEVFVKENPQYTYIFMYDTGKRIYGALTGLQAGAGNADATENREAAGVMACQECMGSRNCFLVDTLADAVALAKRLTEPGKACVMSPAAPSYGVFKNFEERGEKFKEYVMCDCI